MRLLILFSALLLTGCMGMGPEFRGSDEYRVYQMDYELHLHPTRSSLRMAAANHFVSLNGDLCGFVSRRFDEVHVLWPRGWYDSQRLRTIGHETLHVPLKKWHGEQGDVFLCD